MVNAKNVLKVADAIETHSIKTLGFNMAVWDKPYYEDMSGHDCRTCACIGGWTNRVFKRNDPRAGSFEAMKILDLSREERNALFFPNDPKLLFAYKATPKKAAAVLRHLAATGKVNWRVGRNK